jgi:hypothetical protein
MPLSAVTIAIGGRVVLAEAARRQARSARPRLSAARAVLEARP